MQETLVLPDASVEDVVRDVLASVDLHGVDYSVEWAMDYPGQQLAVDLYAGGERELAAAVAIVRDVLAERVGLAVRTSAELDREIRLSHTA